MPGHYGKSKGAMPAKKKSILTAGQKTLPKDLQKKIVASKMKKKAQEDNYAWKKINDDRRHGKAV